MLFQIDHGGPLIARLYFPLKGSEDYNANLKVFFLKKSFEYRWSIGLSGDEKAYYKKNSVFSLPKIE